MPLTTNCPLYGPADDFRRSFRPSLWHAPCSVSNRDASREGEEVRPFLVGSPLNQSPLEERITIKPETGRWGPVFFFFDETIAAETHCFVLQVLERSSRATR